MNPLKRINSTAIIIKTHIWTTDLEIFVKKIFQQTNHCGIDVYVLMHDENHTLYEQIMDPQIKQFTLTFKRATIENIYRTGFYNMWLSNHWILMWFYKQHNYAYIWSMEYDVRISGDSSKIWLNDSSDDFIYTTGFNHCSDSYMHYQHCMNIVNKKIGYLQLARYSRNVLDHLNECFENSTNGQDELAIFSLIDPLKFKCSNILSGFIHGVWSWEQRWCKYNEALYKLAEERGTVGIFHPVK